MAIPRAAYLSAGGHETVRDVVIEDLALAAHLDAEGVPVEAWVGGGIAYRIVYTGTLTVDPEPLPPEHPLWTAPNVIHSMHLSGRSQSRMFLRAAQLFVENLHAFVEKRPLRNQVDLEAGY